jgi:rRNA maturation endonuclease Nob1
MSTWQWVELNCDKCGKIMARMHPLMNQTRCGRCGSIVYRPGIAHRQKAEPAKQPEQESVFDALD